MTLPPIKSQSVIPRLDGIARDVAMLKTLGDLPPEEFAREENFVRAQFCLRRALEGVFHIGSHILSRIPGGRVTEYKAIALRLGDLGIVPQDFAQSLYQPFDHFVQCFEHVKAAASWFLGGLGEQHGERLESLGRLDEVTPGQRAVRHISKTSPGL
jgi:hypothetical protein